MHGLWPSLLPGSALRLAHFLQAHLCPPLPQALRQLRRAQTTKLYPLHRRQSHHHPLIVPADVFRHLRQRHFLHLALPCTLRNAAFTLASTLYASNVTQKPNKAAWGYPRLFCSHNKRRRQHVEQSLDTPAFQIQSRQLQRPTPRTFVNSTTSVSPSRVGSSSRITIRPQFQGLRPSSSLIWTSCS